MDDSLFFILYKFEFFGPKSLSNKDLIILLNYFKYIDIYLENFKLEDLNYYIENNKDKSTKILLEILNRFMKSIK